MWAYFGLANEVERLLASLICDAWYQRMRIIWYCSLSRAACSFDNYDELYTLWPGHVNKKLSQYNISTETGEV